MEFMEWLGNNGIPFAIVFTKIDKLSKRHLTENMRAYAAKMLEAWEELPPVLTSSSETRAGREEILGYIESVNRQL